VGGGGNLAEERRKQWRAAIIQLALLKIGEPKGKKIKGWRVPLLDTQTRISETAFFSKESKIISKSLVLMRTADTVSQCDVCDCTFVGFNVIISPSRQSIAPLN